MSGNVTTVSVPHMGWLSFSADDNVARFLRQGWFEYREQAFFWLYLRNDDVVVDCGAHVGLFSVLAGKILQGTGRVVSIEPNAHTLSLLEENLKQQHLENVVVIEAAVWRKSGKVTLHLMDGQYSAYSSAYFDREGARSAEITAYSIDDILEQQQLDGVSLLKIDVEGAEPDVLEGARAAITAGRIPVIMIEFAEENLSKSGHSTDHLRALLDDMGYTLCRLDEDELRLVPVSLEGPIYYDNFFACSDVAEVNGRLDQADAGRRKIAEDLVARGREAARIYENSEQTVHLRQQVEELKAWAERADRSKVEAERQAAELETWAERAEQGKVEAERQAAELKTWAERAEQGKVEAERQASELKTWAERAEQGKVEAEQRAAESEAQAKSAEEKNWETEKRAAEHLKVLRRSHTQHKLTEKRISYLVERWPLQIAFKTRILQPPLWVAERDAQWNKEDVVERYLAEQALEETNAGRPTNEDESDGLCVSCILCTYNPRSDLLSWALESVARQTMDQSKFEIILVDNNSNPPVDLSEYAVAADLPIRMVREARQGLIFARLAGIREARAELIVFVDDDNQLEPDYFEKAHRIALAEPEIGLFGGIARARLERTIGNWRKTLLPYLGIRDHGSEPITSFDPHWGEWEPIGAGMCSRKDVALAYVDFVENSAAAGGLGRQGKALLSCEDSLYARVANKQGYACSYQPGLVLNHFMTADRLSTSYMFRLIRGLGRSYVRLEHVLGRGENIRPIGSKEVISRFFYRVGKEGVAGALTWAWDVGFAEEAREMNGGKK